MTPERRSESKRYPQQKQIYDKEYIKRFAHYSLPIVTVGINFSTDKHTLTGWVIDDPRKA